MLILTRTVGESVTIANEVMVTVVEVRGDNIRLGFEAAKDINIRRTELPEEARTEKRRT